MSKRTFKREELQEILWRDAGQVHVDEIVSHTRWSVHHRFIFSPEGEANLYETSYSTAATEMQCEKPWEYEDTVECQEVEAFEKKVVDYRPVE
jgi:hypothetical protein